MTGRIVPAETRFWAMVNKTESCWLWTGTTPRGYGLFHPTTKKTVQCHRYAWELIRGPIPDGLGVLHNCPGGDNPTCCNPDHMFLGNQAANMQDAAKKGMVRKGNECHTAKLDAESVRAMRVRYAVGDISYDAIGRENGVCGAVARQAIMGITWKHVV